MHKRQKKWLTCIDPAGGELALQSVCDIYMCVCVYPSLCVCVCVCVQLNPSSYNVVSRFLLVVFSGNKRAARINST